MPPCGCSYLDNTHALSVRKNGENANDHGILYRTVVGKRLSGVFVGGRGGEEGGREDGEGEGGGGEGGRGGGGGGRGMGRGGGRGGEEGGGGGGGGGGVLLTGTVGLRCILIVLSVYCYTLLTVIIFTSCCGLLVKAGLLLSLRVFPLDYRDTSIYTITFSFWLVALTFSFQLVVITLARYIASMYTHV